MQSLKYSILNILCLILFAYFSVLAWKQLTVTTPFFDNDYKTFYLGMHNTNATYQKKYYVRIIQVKKVKHKTKIKSTGAIDAINMDTPPMSFVIKGLVNISQVLSINVAAWVVVSALGAIISLLYISSYLNPFDYRRYFALFLLLLWLSWSSLYNLKLGQVSYFLLPLLCGGFWLFNRGYVKTAAILLGLLAALKLFFLIFLLLYFIRREWKLGGLFLLSFVVFFCAPLLYFSLLDYRQFFQIMLNHEIIAIRSALPMNASLLGVVMHVAAMIKKSQNQLGIQIATLILSLYVFVRWLKYDFDVLRFLPAFSNELRFSFLIVIAILCSPLGWVYYFLFLLIPLIVLFKIARDYALPTSFFTPFALAFILPYFGWLNEATGFLMMLAHFSCFVSLLCWLVCLSIAARAVQNQAIKTKHNASKIMLSILLFSIAINIILLCVNFGMPYFLNFDKTTYIDTAMPASLIS